MKIGFDAKRAFLNPTGLGNYSRWLIDGLLKYQPHNKYFLYTPKTEDRYDPAGDNVFIKTPKLKIFTSRWRTSGIINDIQRDGIQLYHGLSQELPLGVFRKNIKSVVTIHDVIVMHFPRYFGWFNSYIYKAKIINSCRFANKIVAVSQKTKEDLVTMLQVDPGKISVIYQGCDRSFKVPQSEGQLQRVKLKYHLPDNYLLNVGTIEERKNLLLLIKALPQVPGIKLVVVGKPTKYLDKIKACINHNDLHERIMFLHNVPFGALPAIYQQATCFIYPSRYEGFGIPILEAVVSGVPVIAAKGSCLQEPGGPDSLYVDPNDENDLAEKINQVLTDAALRQSMIEKGLQYSVKFDDEKLINQYMDLYNDIFNHA